MKRDAAVVRAGSVETGEVSGVPEEMNVEAADVADATDAVETVGVEVAENIFWLLGWVNSRGIGTL